MPTIHNDQAGIVVDASKALKKVGMLARFFGAVRSFFGGQGLPPGPDTKDVLDAIGQRILRDTGLILQRAGNAPGGRPWQVMAPMTLRMRPQRASTHHFSSPYQTLLQQSMNVATGAGKTVDAARATVEVGTNVRYAKDHHFGAGRIPARPLLPTKVHAGEAARQTVEAIVNQLATSVNRA